MFTKMQRQDYRDSIIFSKNDMGKIAQPFEKSMTVSIKKWVLT